LDASPSAAGGGCSEGAACVAVGVQRRRVSQGAHRVPQTDTGAKSFGAILSYERDFIENIKVL
jgi:hypothetical protein